MMISMINDDNLNFKFMVVPNKSEVRRELAGACLETLQLLKCICLILTTLKYVSTPPDRPRGPRHRAAADWKSVSGLRKY